MLIVLLFLLFGTSVNLQAQCGCDTILGLTQTEFDAGYLEGGDTICLQGGIRTEPLLVEYINRGNDDTIKIVIINYESVVVFQGSPSEVYCLRLDSSKYFKITGTGEPYAYNQLELYSPYPNPATGNVNIRFFLPIETEITTRLISVQGKEVILEKMGKLRRGTHTINLDLKGLAPGTYFYRLEGGGMSCTGVLSIVSY